MVGAFAFGVDDHLCGYREGLASGGELMFRLTIGTDDVERFVADKEHLAAARGYMSSDVLGGRLAVQAGAFNLFVDEGPRVKHMLYRLYFSDSVGRPLTLAGFKDVHPGPLSTVWSETSTLYIRVLDGHRPVMDGGAAPISGVVGAGILRIRPLDFAWQLSTFRVHGPTRSGQLKALAAFGRLFVGELSEVFLPSDRRRHG
jgi:cholesterol oxidase